MPLNEGAVSEILPFAPDATEAAGELEPLESYAAHMLRLRGHQPGLARLEIQNRANRQSAHIASGVAQFIANRYAPGVRDDGDLDKIEAGMETVIWDMIMSAVSGIDTGIPVYASGAALPTENIGPIWHADYASLMTWQIFNANGASYFGYASVLLGSLLLDTQPTPRTGYVKSGTANLDRAVYAPLRHWAIHHGRKVDVGAWEAGEILVADNADGTTFRVFDVRGEFFRAWDDGRGIVSQGFGEWVADALQGHFHESGCSGSGTLYTPQSSSSAGYKKGFSLNNFPDFVQQPKTDGTNGNPRIANETRSRGPALLAVIKI